MWDIPSGTGLAIHIDVLPAEAPQTALHALPLASQGVFQQQGSVAVIDISGVITPYSNILSALFGGTDVQSISDQFENAVNDPSVGGIVFRIDSPGGIITGVEELASTIAAARGKKPIIAYAYGNAASAAYWIASAADKIVAGPRRARAIGENAADLSSGCRFTNPRRWCPCRSAPARCASGRRSG